MRSDEPDGRPVEPRPPEHWPAYLADPIRRQDPDTLEEVAAFATQLAEHRRNQQDATDERLDAAASESVEAVEETGDGYIVVKKQLCGKDGCRCSTGDLHGPYRWRVTTSGDGAEWEYLGKASGAEH